MLVSTHTFQVETEPACEPEEYGYKPGYYQEWDVTFRYEGAELATCSIDSDGDYRAEKWVGEPAKWPTLLQGLVLLPELVIEEPSDHATDYEKRELDLFQEMERRAGGGALERIEEGPGHFSEQGMPDLPGLDR